MKMKNGKNEGCQNNGGKITVNTFTSTAHSTNWHLKNDVNLNKSMKFWIYKISVTKCQ
jgi:hypothetical protein